MAKSLRHPRRRWRNLILCAIASLICVGCHTLPPSQQPSFRAAEDNKKPDVNPQLAGFAELFGILLYYGGPFLP